MRLYQEVKYAFFVFINLFSLVNYTILGERLIYMSEKFPKTSIFSTKNVNILYLCLLIFVGIRIFALFVGRNLNDWFLHRSLNNGGTYTKLRILFVLILIEQTLFNFYICYNLYPFTVLSNTNFKGIIIMISFAFYFNLLNLLIIFLIHPDLLGIKYRKSISKYCDRMERRRQMSIEIY